MSEQLKVEVRDQFGTRSNRRLRAKGTLPAILYGHGKENVALSVAADDFDAVLRHGNRLVSLTGGVNESAFIRDLQWDTWGQEVLHIDFTRMAADEKVEVAVPIELRGEAPGLREGGVVEQTLHELRMECRADQVPESIEVSVNELNLGDSISVTALDVPTGATILDDIEGTVVHCIEPVEIPEEGEEAAEPGAGEPEVIGEKEGDESGEGESEEK